ncbi:hypothetical protein ACH5RR_011624 [Cinchona calisaya]|uniref:Uncharacterized protein n=1 Tax=Cinchona calisaya TaxID=153742 RepID=A0ABD3ABA9_9GENT
MFSTRFGVRKGSWTAEEDILLRNCIEKHGEGKWHQIPLKAGLNRSRLRWLNSLRPNIKRGAFASDGVDLIIRWSLISGRIPGRTANDVKNFWNSHVQKKLTGRQENLKGSPIKPEKAQISIFKPHPLNLSKHVQARSSLRNATHSIKNQEFFNESESSNLMKPFG